MWNRRKLTISGGNRPDSERRRSNRLSTIERLEPRQLLVSSLAITEFMASNGSTLLDADGNSPDWIEIYNGGETTVDLAGHRLTDSAEDLSKFVLPRVNLNPREYLIVFASGQDANSHVDAQGNLHANFRLSAAREYLALVSPDGNILSEFGTGGADYPPQFRDVSYGTSNTQALSLVDASSDAQYLVPLGGPTGITWTLLDYDATANGFNNGQAAIGYETQPESRTNFTGQFLTELAAGEHAVYVRIPFHLDEASAVTQMTLDMKYDNGFIAYLNGVKVAEENAPQNPDWFSTAPNGRRRDSEALEPVSFDMSPFRDQLIDGENVLAIHGLNELTLDKADMLVVPQLSARVLSGDVRVGYLATPTPGAANTEAMAGVVSFSRPGGVFTEPFQVELTTVSKTADIRYTLDGSEPTFASAKYTGPLSISASQKLRARAFEVGFLPGPVHSEGYLKLAADVEEFRSELPIVVVDTFGERIPPRTQEPASAYSVIIDISGASDRAAMTDATDYAGPAGLRIRGRSTGSYPKKQYKFETWDQNGNDLDVPLLGMPAESDWVLYASYSDKSLLRNFTTYRWWEELGYWSPRTRLVEVFLNDDGDNQISYADDYNGVYVLLEGIKAGSDRLNVSPPENTTELEAITGGYVIEMGNADSAQDFNTRVSGQLVAYRFNDPRKEELNDVQQQWMRDYVTAFETALYNEDFQHPTTEMHFTEYIDVGSFVDYEIMRQFARNFDGGSTYFSIDRGGKLRMGPLWDYNWSLGNVNYAEGGDVPGYRTDGWNISYTTNLNGWSPWWRRLDQNTDYWQQFIDRWHELRQGVLSDANFHADIDANAALLSLGAADRNFQRWDILGRSINISPPGFRDRDTYQKEVDSLKDWLVERAAWMDSRFVAPANLAPAGGKFDAGQPITILAESGTIYYTLDGTDPRASGGGVAPHAQIYEGPITLEQPGTITVRVKIDDQQVQPVTTQPGRGRLDLIDTGKKDGSAWSAPMVVGFSETISVKDSLRITEINYHPHAVTPEIGEADTDNDDFEFIELMNVGADAINLEGVRLAEIDFNGTGQGVEFAFGPIMLQPDQRTLVVGNRAAFESRYGTGLNIAGEFAGRLSNRGERITLLDAAGAVIHSFDYDDLRPWPSRAAGSGSSLEVVDTSGNYQDPNNWRASNDFGGSPGTASSQPISGLTINEILAHSQLLDGDMIELHNTSAHAIDISQWYITDSEDDFFKAQIPEGTTIAIGGYLVITQSQLGFDLDGVRGGQLWLIEADASGRPKRFALHTRYGNSAPGVSLGRWPNATGSFYQMAQPTFGAANSSPRAGDVVISEVYYNPIDPDERGPAKANELEFIELYNRTDRTIDLAQWRLVGSSEFTFPAGTTIGAAETILLVGFDPNNLTTKSIFQFTLSVPPSVQLLGPYSLPLDDSAGRLRLEQSDAAIADDPDFEPYFLQDEVNYRDVIPWPISAAGQGDSLSRTRPTDLGNYPASWIAGVPSPGAPQFTQHLPGDANADGLFNQLDIVSVLQAGKYLTGQPATRSEGDWTGDGLFNQQDLVEALQSGTYRPHPAAAEIPSLLSTRSLRPTAIDMALEEVI